MFAIQVPRILRLVKVLRLLKMLRIASLAKLPALTYKVEWLLNRPMVQLATLCATCCMLLHWIACVWYWAAMLGGDGGWVASAGMVRCRRLCCGAAQSYQLVILASAARALCAVKHCSDVRLGGGACILMTVAYVCCRRLMQVMVTSTCRPFISQYLHWRRSALVRQGLSRTLCRPPSARPRACSLNAQVLSMAQLHLARCPGR